MYFEYRHYEADVGKGPALDRRFKDVTLRIFARHGFEVVGLWHTYVGDRGLHYILRWQSLDQMEKAWTSFHADPEWQEARIESERDGQLTRHVSNQIWVNAPFMPTA